LWRRERTFAGASVSFTPLMLCNMLKRSAQAFRRRHRQRAADNLLN